MKNLHCIIFLFLFIGNVPAQGKEDNILPFGYGSFYSHINPPFGLVVFGGQLIDFSKNELEITAQDFPAANPQSTICNPYSGKLIAFTDGCRIVNQNFELMINGEGINLGNVHDNYCGTVPGGESIYPLYQGFQFLPAPGKINQYYLLQLYMQTALIGTSALKYSTLNFSNDTLGEVEQKDVVVFEGAQLSAYVTSAKHANGQDWWIIVPAIKKNLYYINLATSKGIQKVTEQSIGFPSETDTMELKEWGGQICFSPDGTKFIKYLPYVGIYIFDFDRCEGMLSNPLFISFLDQPEAGGGVSVSPNSRFLYVSAADRVEQYDLQSSDVISSKIVVAFWDGYQAPFGTHFGQAVSAPDGKIYMITGNNHVLHVIDEPNKPGLLCDVRPHGIRLISLTDYFAPNIPHFRLGPNDGSICDSLGINNLPMADFRWHHADSSDLLTVYFRNLAWGEPETWHWDFGEGTSSTDTSVVHTYAAAGTYNVCQIVSNQYGMDTLCREVNITLPSSAVENPAVLNYQAEILPNPTRGQCYIMSTGDPGLSQRVVLYDQLGREVLQKQWIGESTSLDLNRLSSGMYFWKVFINNQLLHSGKIIKAG